MSSWIELKIERIDSFPLQDLDLESFGKKKKKKKRAGEASNIDDGNDDNKENGKTFKVF